MSERTDTAHTTWNRMFQDGKLTEDQFHSGLLCIAKQAIDDGEPQTARDLVAGVTEKYLADVLPVQMKKDPVFCSIVNKLALALVGPLVDEEEIEVDLALLRGPIAKA